MEKLKTQIIYSESAVEFVTVAVQLCLYLEQMREQDRVEMIEKLLCLLPLLYLKARLVKKPVMISDGYVEKFVTEMEYESIRQLVADKMGSDDAYLEVNVDDMRYSDEPITCFVSENVADIYQELKDLACNYQTGNEEVMNDALLECLEGFEAHWGQKLLNMLRPLHALSLGEDE